MSLFKEPRYESKKLLKAACGAPCMCCGAQSQTVVGAHYTGLRQHDFGKGRGIKCSDSYCAFLCIDCHRLFDNPEQHKSIEASEAFLLAIVKTHHWLLCNNVMVIK